MLKPATCFALAGLALAACATPRDLPAIRYLDAEYRGAAAPRVDAYEYRRQAQLWRDAVIDARACGLPSQEVVSAAFAARSELTAMREHAEGNTSGVITGLLTDLVMNGGSGGVRPGRGRCQQLSRWLPSVQRRREEAGDWSVLERLLGGAGLP